MKRILATALCAIMMLTMLSAFTVSYAVGGTVYMTGDVNVRTGPGLGYSVIDALYKGSTRSATGNYAYDNRGVCWYEIYHGYGRGWVSSRYSSFSGSTYSYSGYTDYSWSYGGYADTITGITGDSNVRTGPGLSYASFGVLDKGESAAYLGNSSVDSRGVVWYQISYNGRVGWVSSRYTTPN